MTGVEITVIILLALIVIQVTRIGHTICKNQVAAAKRDDQRIVSILQAIKDKS